MTAPAAIAAADPVVSRGVDAMSTPASDEPRASRVFVAAVPHEFARNHLVLGVGPGGDPPAERLLIADRTPPWIPWNVGARLNTPVRPERCDAERLALAIDRAYAETTPTDADDGDPESAARQADLAAERVLRDLDRDLLSIDGKAPVVRLVDALLFEALARRASDIHIQPLADRTLVRERVDGVLFDVRQLPAALAGAVVSRIKVMAQMDLAERAMPQDGRATVTLGAGRSASRSVDLRISTLPTSYGERAVVRLLDPDRGRTLTDFEALGLPPPVRAALLDRVGRSSGIVLVTGPTGSGKTTTLYATLRLLATPARGALSGELNIMTIEDPIEYELSTVGLAISQTQVMPKKGLTFAGGLRHILRQDPDVVMVGEIRDAETARIAMQASLTGHLVLSTLHTNDAAAAVTRLSDLGVEPYLISASLSAVLAQRLLRLTHAPCAGAGCAGCFHAGFRGRSGVFELLAVTDDARALIAARAGERAIRDAARAAGMRTLQEEGDRWIREGRTTAAEVRRVLHGIEDRPEDIA